MQSLDYYLTFARKYVSSRGLSYLNKDEDAISFIAGMIMQADDNWNAKIPREIWLLTNARYGVGKVLRKKKRENKNPHISLSYAVDDGYITEETIEDVRQRQPIGVIDAINNLAEITDRDRKCLYDHIIEGRTYADIGYELNISGERVRQIINNTLQTIRERIGSELV